MDSNRAPIVPAGGDGFECKARGLGEHDPARRECGSSPQQYFNPLAQLGFVTEQSDS
jgi:hypothetical protein